MTTNNNKAADRKAIFAQLYRENLAKMTPSCRVGNGTPWFSAQQIASAKARAMKGALK